MSSALVSLARTFRRPGGAPDWPGRALDCSGRWCEPFAWFDPATSCWRTWRPCSVEGWEPFSEPWPRAGMTRSGIAYRRPTLAPRTYGTGYGQSPTHSIPTPTASDHIQRRSTSHGGAELLSCGISTTILPEGNRDNDRSQPVGWSASGHSSLRRRAFWGLGLAAPAVSAPLVRLATGSHRGWRLGLASHRHQNPPHLQGRRLALRRERLCATTLTPSSTSLAGT
jgi:hypothetical protein